MDSMFMSLDYHKTIPYKQNCEKPPAFRGAGKFKVSCLIYEYEFPPKYLSEFFRFHRLGYYGWHAIGSVEQIGDDLSSDYMKHDIRILERPQSEYPNCKRQIFMTFSDGFKSNTPTIGDKIYFADPRKLYCTHS